MFEKKKGLIYANWLGVFEKKRTPLFYSFFSLCNFSSLLNLWFDDK